MMIPIVFAVTILNDNVTVENVKREILNVSSLSPVQEIIESIWFVECNLQLSVYTYNTCLNIFQILAFVVLRNIHQWSIFVLDHQLTLVYVMTLVVV